MSVWLHVYVCVGLCVCPCVCVSAPAFVCLCLRVCVSAHAFVCLRLRVCLLAPGKMAEKTAFDSWMFAHYFEFINEKDCKNIVVKCNLCVGRHLLSTAKNSTSNLKKTPVIEAP